ncbi:MAG TPA: DUF1697 domain-containing protein [Acidimicrobiia bacterium]|nr:DUF1697 domain-containing protein [Acidimicrobiia bacterium]
MAARAARYVAFLGGINVGGHRISMEALRAEFAAMGYADVTTFIASGNVVFMAGGAVARLESRIEAELGARLGYVVPTFLRTPRALAAAVALEPFGSVGSRDTYLVNFLHTAPSAAARRATEALSNRRDRFEVHGKELHWLVVNGGVSDTTVKPTVLRRALGQPTTTRNVKSLRTLAARLAG